MHNERDFGDFGTIAVPEGRGPWDKLRPPFVSLVVKRS
jgi:hypothetical protein